MITLPDPTSLPQDDPRALAPPSGGALPNDRGAASCATLRAEMSALGVDCDALGGFCEGQAERRADELQAEIDAINARRKTEAGPVAAGCTVISFAAARRRLRDLRGSNVKW